MRARLVLFITIIQLILFAVHAFVYGTCVYFFGPLTAPAISALRIAFALLSISFVTGSVLAFRFSNAIVRTYYILAAAWLGTFNFLALSSCACWLAYGVWSLLGFHPARHTLGVIFLGVALVPSVYGLINAAVIRVTRITVTLADLPAAWRGRTAALVSDVHLGHVRNLGFIRRIAKMVAQLKPDILFITGDLYDGTAADFDGLAAPWSSVAPPLGKYFVLGNHEGFTSSTRYLDAVSSAGIRILDKEKVELDGLQLVGVHYHDATHAEHFRSVLQNINIDRARPSILLTHAPDHLPVSVDAGISLQLSGHTHRGQFFPFATLVRRMYGPFAYGLNRLGKMWAYTTSGAGTWGPPLRVGTNAEIVLIRFE